MNRTAVILAAGAALRMEPLSRQRPKAMFLVAGKPLVQHAVEAALDLGCSHAVVVVRRGETSIQSFLGDGARFGIPIRYVPQDTPSGSGHALRLGIVGVEGDVVVLPGASFLGPGIANALNSTTVSALVGARATSGHRQALPVVDGGNLVRFSWEDASIGSSRVSTGIWFVTKAVVAALAGTTESAVEDAIASLAGQVEIRVEDAEGVWEPVVDPWDVLRINERALRGTEIRLGENTDIHDSAVLVPPVWIGDGVHIGERAVVGPNVAVRTNSRIGALCEVRESILNNNVAIDSRCVLRGCIVDDGASLGAAVLAPDGAIVGADAIVPHGTVLQPGFVIDSANQAIVEASREAG